MAQVYTVSQINTYIKSIFQRDYVLSRITVGGEVSNCRYHGSGHIYFTLKDAGAQLSCVMFSSSRTGLKFRLRDGQQIEASGQISVYEKNGSYQLYVRSCRMSGEGELYEKFLRLKEKLEDMGMFDELYKKPIPAYVRRLGVVTAPTGAAIQDIINISTRRNPYVEITLYPARVQGEGAARTIADGIHVLDAMDLDCIIIGRGGGSIEDLWAFNEEIVAEAVFEAHTPVISAVGHETDFTIADFVADLRAPTPSAAAELANFIYDELEEELAAFEGSMRSAVMRKTELISSRLTAYGERLRRLSPEMQLKYKRERASELLTLMERTLAHRSELYSARLSGLSESLGKAMGSKLDSSAERLGTLALRLDGASPLKKMSGGYGYLEDGRKKAVKSIKDLSAGDYFRAYLSDGYIEAETLRLESGDKAYGG